MWSAWRSPGTAGPIDRRSSIRSRPCSAAPPLTPSTTTSDAQSLCPALSQLRTLPPPVMGRLESMLTMMLDPRAATNRSLSREKVVGSYFLGFPAVTVADPEAVKELSVLEQQGTVTIGWPPATVQLIGEHALTNVTDNKKHRMLRRLMVPALGSEAVDQYLPEIAELADKMLSQWEASSRQGRTSLAMPDVKSFTFAVITKVVLGMEDLTPEEMSTMEAQFNVWITSLFTPLTVNRWPFPFHRSMAAREQLITRILITVRKERDLLAAEALEHSTSTPDNGHSSFSTMAPSPQLGPSQATGRSASGRISTLRRMLIEVDEEGNQLSDIQVADNLLALLFAGHDTSSSHIASLLFDLTTRPQVVDALRAEQKDIIQRFGDAMTPEAVRAMKYAQAVAQETMRLRPIIGGTLRTAPNDFPLQGMRIPGKHLLSINLGWIARNDPRWPHGNGAPTDGLEYNPSRFLTEEGAKTGSQMYFGHGARSCLGIALATAEVRVFLAVLARRFKVVADVDTKFVLVPIPRPANNLPVWVERLG